MKEDEKLIDGLIELGECRRPHGINGGVVFSLYNDRDSLLKSNSKIFISPEMKNYSIRDISFGNKTIVYLDGIEDRNSAEAIIPFKIYISRDNFPEIDPSEEDDCFYIVDLLNVDVISFIEQKKVGKIIDFYESGDTPIFIIELDKTREKIDVPYVDHFFKDVDLELGVVTVLLPEIVE